jgi:glutamate synthase (NADPH/NADH) large chain
MSGNVNWMKSHEIKMASPSPSAFSRRYQAVIQAGGSDTAALDATCSRCCARGPRRADGQAMLVPEAWQNNDDHAPGHKDMFLLQLGDGAVGRPGRAGDDRWPLGDRGHGPQRAAPAALHHHRDNLLIVGSETGMVVDAGPRSSRRAAWPRARCSPSIWPRAPLHDRAIKDARRRSQPYRDGQGLPHRSRSHPTDAAGGPPCSTARAAPPPDRRRHDARGHGADPSPMVEDARKPSARWATTRRSRCCRTSRGLISHFFRQNFSQVTNPPIDSCANAGDEPQDALGNLGNILDEGQQNAACRLVQLG